MIIELPDLESVIPLKSRRVKQMNFISETRMPKENMKKEKTFHKSLSAYMLYAAE